jgi:rubrerythrin
MNLQECFLKLAKSEKEAGELYKNFSKGCSERLKPIVISFSMEEEKHKSYMLELSSNEKLKEKHLQDDVEVIFKNQTDYLSKNDEILNIASEKDFFGFALKIEKDSVEIYTKLLDAFQRDSSEYKGFEALIKEERKHMIYILNKLYELK